MAPVRRPDFHSGAVHPIQARRAFEPGADAYLARLVELRVATTLLEFVPDQSRRTVVPILPSRLKAILERTDLTKLIGQPLVLVNEGYRVLAVATGPSEAPRQLRVQSNISRIENGEAVEIPATDASQPSLQLVALSCPGEPA